MTAGEVIHAGMLLPDGDTPVVELQPAATRTRLLLDTHLGSSGF